MDLLSPYAPLWPWLLERCHQNMRVVRNPDDPPSLQLRNEGQIEISTYDPDPEHASNILLHRRDGPTDERWCGWCRSVDYRADLTHFPTRGHVLVALATYGHHFPWAAGSIWSPLTDDQAGRLTAEIVRRVGPDPKAPARVLPNGVLGPVIRHEGAGLYPGVYQESRRELVGSPYCPSSEGGKRQRGYPGPRGWSCGPHQGQETGDLGRAMAERRAMDLGAILVEQITPKS